MNAAEFVAKPSHHTLESESRICRDARASDATPLEPIDAPDGIDAIDARDVGVLALVELILKNRQGLYQLIRSNTAPVGLLSRLLAIALFGFVLFGITMSLLLTVSGHWPSLTPVATWLEMPSSALLRFDAIDGSWGKLGPWVSGEALALIEAYAFGLVATSGVALASLYFYCLLAGVRMSMLDVVIHAVKSKAIAAVALVGILPIYVAIAMGVVIFDFGPFWLRTAMLLGLVLPLVAGFWGTASLYQGFAQLCDTMPPDRAAKRECFLRRLVLSWSACYTAIMPVMIYSLWEVFSRT